MSRTKSNLSRTKTFCPRQKIFCPGQKFCPLLETSFPNTKMIFKPSTKFLSRTKYILSWTNLFCLGQIWFCPRQRTFCPGRWTGQVIHIVNSELGPALFYLAAPCSFGILVVTSIEMLLWTKVTIFNVDWNRPETSKPSIFKTTTMVGRQIFLHLLEETHTFLPTFSLNF